MCFNLASHDVIGHGQVFFNGPVYIRTDADQSPLKWMLIHFQC